MASINLMSDLYPEITKVQFEITGNKVTAKIQGKSLWFVYNVSIEGINGAKEELTVDLTKSSECELQTTVQEKHVDFQQEVSARVKTHFHNSEYLPLQTEITAETTVSIVLSYMYLV